MCNSKKIRRIVVLNNTLDRIRLLFRKERESYLCFYRMLGFFPRNITVYKQALLHKSSSVKSGKGRLLNNERLEFLGDAVLDAVVADIVYKKFEGRREGFLTNTRSKIVQRETLNRVAVEIGLDKLVKSATRQSSHNSYLCGNAFEALVGAIYLDRGYEACKWFMEERIINRYLNLEKISKKEVNFKSKLIEWSQKNKFEISFDLTEQSFDENQNPTFKTQVMVEGICGGSGDGYSKKESQQVAAKATLGMIKSAPVFIDAIFAAKNEREKQAEASSEQELATIPLEEAVADEGLASHFEETENIIVKAEEAAFSES